MNTERKQFALIAFYFLIELIPTEKEVGRGKMKMAEMLPLKLENKTFANISCITISSTQVCSKMMEIKSNELVHKSEVYGPYWYGL